MTRLSFYNYYYQKFPVTIICVLNSVHSIPTTTGVTKQIMKYLYLCIMYCELENNY